MSFMHPSPFPEATASGETVRIYEKGVEEHSTVRPELGKLCSQVPVAKFAKRQAR